MNVTTNMSQSDINDIKQNITNFQALTGKSVKEGVRWATVKILTSLQSKTKESKPKRPVRVRAGGKKKQVFVTLTKKLFLMQAFSGGKEKTVPIFAETLQAAKQHPRTWIRKKGMAKASHGWAMMDLFDEHLKQTSKKRIQRPANALKTTKDETTLSLKVTVENRIRYIIKALRGGNSSLSLAVKSANEGMRFQIENNTFGKFGK